MQFQSQIPCVFVSVTLLADLSPLQLLSLMHQGHSLIEAAMKQQKEKFGRVHLLTRGMLEMVILGWNDKFFDQEMTEAS